MTDHGEGSRIVWSLTRLRRTLSTSLPKGILSNQKHRRRLRLARLRPADGEMDYGPSRDGIEVSWQSRLWHNAQVEKRLGLHR